MNTNLKLHTIHPANYAPIQALRQHRPSPADAQEVVILVTVSGTSAGPQPLTFRWRADLNCWHSAQPICIQC